MRSSRLYILRAAAARALAVAAVATALGAAGYTRAAALEIRDPRVTVICPLTVGAAFKAKTTALTGEIALEGDALGDLAGTLSVDLTTLDTGIDLRNHHMQEKYLEVGKGDGFKDARLSAIKIDAPKLDAELKFHADLTVHGETKPVTGTCKIHKNGTAYEVEAGFPVNVLEFKIAKPSYLGVGVEDEVRVTVAFTAAPKGPTSAGSN